MTVTPGTTAFKAIEFLGGANNSGNIVFVDALNALIPGLENLTSRMFVRRSRTLPAGTVVLLPLANFMSATWQAPEGFLDALEGFTPVLVSVGVQCDLNCPVERVSLSVDCTRLLSQVKHANTLVGARGEFTKRVLSNHGVDSIVIGCPSTYVGIPGSICFPDKARLSVCTNNSFSGDLRAIAGKINTFSYRHATGFVCQNEEGVILDIMGIPEPVSDFIASQSVNPQHASLLQNRLFSYGYYNDGSAEWGALHEWFVGNSKFFLDIHEWREYASGFDLSIGLRFHGNVVALQAGIPALVVVPDMRVRELVDFSGLPYIETQDMNGIESAQDFRSFFSLEKFLDGKTARENNLKRFLGEYFSPESVFL